jgi:hypothetical protein
MFEPMNPEPPVTRNFNVYLAFSLNEYLLLNLSGGILALRIPLDLSGGILASPIPLGEPGAACLPDEICEASI